jgi:hypothetical protein
MALPWVRLDSHIASHDKILSLLNDPSGKRWQAAASYMFALGWSGDHGTDGFIPKTALPFVHGTVTTARLLVKYRLWEEELTGWSVHNFGVRQELSAVTAGKNEARRVASEKANCKRWHGETCWRDGGCSRATA